MVRIGLTIYLVLATVAGPGFCCCGAARLAQLLAFGGSKSGQLAAPPHRKSCCHHEQPSAPDQQKTPSRDHGKPGCPDRPTCPCHQSGSGMALPSQGTEQLNQVLVRSLIEGRAELVSAPHPTCLLSLGTDSRGLGEAVALPFLSAHDFLTTFHILRC
jgi:hypothetical protein